MNRISALSMIVVTVLLAPATVLADTHQPQMLAEEVNVPAAEPPRGKNVPRRGMSMAQVQRTWGSPTSQLGAVGEPPITRWIYDGFTVYFEHRAVIHAVQHSSPGRST